MIDDQTILELGKDLILSAVADQFVLGEKGGLPSVRLCYTEAKGEEYGKPEITFLDSDGSTYTIDKPRVLIAYLVNPFMLPAIQDAWKRRDFDDWLYHLFNRKVLSRTLAASLKTNK